MTTNSTAKLLLETQPRTQVLFSSLLAGGRYPGECWLGATNMTLAGELGGTLAF